MNRRTATGLAFITSFCVLVLEILAGRLLAPLIGVSLETFTGIIGTVLAGIALGAALGGRAADRMDPTPLIGPLIMIAGGLTWLAPVTVTMFGSVQGSDPATIVVLSALTFVAPAAVLSAISPMVAKLLLRDLGDTGRIVGSLSAAGTAGALVGTFLTGFVLVRLAPTRTLLFAVGLGLIILGALQTGWGQMLAKRQTTLGVGSLIVLAGVGAVSFPPRCDAETAYACIEFVADPQRPTGRTLVLNQARNSYIDLTDPSHLEFRYLRLFGDITAVNRSGPIEGLHIGGAGFTFPRYLRATGKGGTQTVLEIDGGLVDFTRSRLPPSAMDGLDVVIGDARLTLDQLPDNRFDIVYADAFGGLTVPWHLATVEFVTGLDRVLVPDGMVVMNLIDGGDLGFLRAELATYAQRFDYLGVVAPPGWDDQTTQVARYGRNYVLIASHRPITRPEVGPRDGVWLDPPAVAALVGGAAPLTDDFAPVDQIRRAS